MKYTIYLQAYRVYIYIYLSLSLYLSIYLFIYLSIYQYHKRFNTPTQT